MILKSFAIALATSLVVILSNCTQEQKSAEKNDENGTNISSAEISETEKFLTILLKLDKSINLLFERKKIEQLKRELNYVRNDLKDYLEIRRQLMEKAETLDYNIRNNNDVLIYFRKLKSAIAALDHRLFSLSQSDAFPHELDKDIEHMRSTSVEQRLRYLSVLDESLDRRLVGVPVEKDRLRKEGRRIFDNLNKAVGTLDAMQQKLTKKLEAK